MLKGTLLSTAIDLVQISGSVVQNYGHLHHFAVGNCQLVEITSFVPLCGGIALSVSVRVLRKFQLLNQLLRMHMMAHKNLVQILIRL